MKGGPVTRLWQRNYYDHIIRNQQDLELTWLYVESNPANGKRITRTLPNTNHHLRFCIMATYPVGRVAFVIRNLSCIHTNCDNYYLLCDNYHLNRDYNVAEYS